MADKRILIADADPTACEKFRQALGDAWIIVGAFTGGAALTEAQRQPFDVLVANYELPELHGAELLNRLREACPKTLRFIAAAESLREKVVCEVLGGHQFLAIPYERAALKSSIERSLADNYGMTQKMRDLVGRIRTFPTIPSLYLEVVNALKNPNTTTDQIGNIIAKDMAMTTKLVQVLNSAYFGLPRRITDPTEAVGILGFETVKSLIVSVKLMSHYDKVKPVYFSIDQIWKHSTNVARTAKAMALLETGDTDCSGDAYTAGLMHDVGKVVLAANFDEQYTRAHALARQNQTPLWEVEKEIFGASHGEIGAYLLGLWGMSEEIIKVTAMHHQPQRSGDKKFTALTAVHVANALEYEGNMITPDGLPVAVVDSAYLQQVGLEERIEAWRDALRDPEAVMSETRIWRAKSALKPSATAAPNPVALQFAPKAKKFAPAELPQPVLLCRSLTKWLTVGLGVSAFLALLAWLEVLRVENAAEKPAAQEIAEHIAPPTRHEAAESEAPVKKSQESATPPKPAPVATPVTTSPAVSAPAPAPSNASKTTALDRLKLEGIFFSSQPTALINGQLTMVNQLVADCRVLDITPSSVTLEYQQQRKTLNLH